MLSHSRRHFLIQNKSMLFYQIRAEITRARQNKLALLKYYVILSAKIDPHCGTDTTKIISDKVTIAVDTTVKENACSSVLITSGRS